MKCLVGLLLCKILFHRRLDWFFIALVMVTTIFMSVTFLFRFFTRLIHYQLHYYVSPLNIFIEHNSYKQNPFFMDLNSSILILNRYRNLFFINHAKKIRVRLIIKRILVISIMKIEWWVIFLIELIGFIRFWGHWNTPLLDIMPGILPTLY